jgi:hypothetical protein
LKSQPQAGAVSMMTGMLFYRNCKMRGGPESGSIDNRRNAIFICGECIELLIGKVFLVKSKM